MLYIDSIEVAEMLYPIRVHDRRLVPDTEGAGQFTGAPSSMAEFGPVDCAMSVNFVSDGCQNVALGVRGGGPGGPARQYVRRLDGSLDPLPGVTSIELAPGERLVAYTCGGGGYGRPADRDPELVQREVREGRITPQRAREVYGAPVQDG
jgi:N-methylhydantoinase B